MPNSNAHLVIVDERYLHQVLQPLQQRPPALLRSFQDRDVSLQSGQGQGQGVLANNRYVTMAAEQLPINESSQICQLRAAAHRPPLDMCLWH